MSDGVEKMLGLRVRDTVSGVSGVVIGVVSWLHNPIYSLIIQPPSGSDGSVPSTVYVPMPAAQPLGPIPTDRIQ